MRKLYLIVLGAKLDRQQVLDYLSDIPNTGGWFYSMPSSFFIKSSLSAEEISARIRSRFGNLRFFITEVHENRQGLMPKDHWKLFYK